MLFANFCLLPAGVGLRRFSTFLVPASSVYFSLNLSRFTSTVRVSTTLVTTSRLGAGAAFSGFFSVLWCLGRGISTTVPSAFFRISLSLGLGLGALSRYAARSASAFSWVMRSKM